jgi:ligand-binding SRPBCC domain-containing protein
MPDLRPTTLRRISEPSGRHARAAVHSTWQGTQDAEFATMTYILERRQVVSAPLSAVFAFFAEPRNLSRITPPWLAFRMVDPEGVTMRAGAAIEYRIRPLFVPQRWVSEITRYDPPHAFVDEQRSGPYRSWRHEHGFSHIAGGTEIVERVEYALPFGPAGRLVHALFVRRQLESIFDYRGRIIARLFDPSSGDETAPATSE